MRKRDVEILAPAGSFECLKAAVCAGADAVYAGGSRFGARAYADNFQEKELLDALDYVHLHGRKMYLTVNTLVKESELESFREFLIPYYRQGLDGVIVQDLGAGSLIREEFPGLELHASTQMTITGVEGATFLEQQGYVRVVPARELSLREIRDIKTQTGLEVECFVHGALCYCYSGQCLLSSMIGGRSGNRGQCAQPCRLPYRAGAGQPEDLMSLKDLCTIDMLPELLEAGIDSFKIEGRMKKPEYVWQTVEIYRRYASLYLEGGVYQVTEEDRGRLYGAYQRRGYTEGYYRQHNGKQMISLKRPPEIKEEGAGSLPELKKQEKINGKFIFSPEKPATLILERGKVRISCQGPVPEPAKKQPLDAARIEIQMRKTGGSEFQMDQMEVLTEGELFLPMQALNELRRNGLERLKEEILRGYRRSLPQSAGNPAPIPVQTGEWEQTAEREGEDTVRPLLAAAVESAGQFRTACACPDVSRIYVDSLLAAEPEMMKLWKDRDPNREYFLAMPHIFRKEIRKTFEKSCAGILDAFDGVLIRNLESLEWLRNQGYTKPVLGDYNLYVWNHKSRKLLKEAGLWTVTAPAELNQRELARLGIQGQAITVYGYQPVMVTANCIRKTTKGCCKKTGYSWIQDRYRKKFAVKNCCEYCYNIIYNSAPLFLADLAEQVKELSPGEIRMNFSQEQPREMEAVLRSCRDAFLRGKAVKTPGTEFTRGHFKRGVK